MIAKTLNIRCFVAKMHLSRFTLSDNKCPLFARLGGGVAERGQCPLFLPFFLLQGFPYSWLSYNQITDAILDGVETCSIIQDVSN